MWPAISVSLISFAIALLAVGWLAHSRALQLALDEPNARSLHTRAVPRTGGIGLLLGVATGWTFIATSLSWPVWCALAIVIAVSLIDDLRGLPAAVRLAVHLLAATLAAISLLGNESTLLIAVAILGISWMCNLYNFMDGSDGLAGGMAAFGFLAYATAAALSGNTAFALVNLAIAAAATGFLVHNFHPARIFLGDTGSVTLGFLAALNGLTGWLQGNWTWWFPLTVFSPFIVDASATLARRLFSGARVWEAHRDHYYQRLVQLGLGHRKTALAEYALMTICGGCSLWIMTGDETAQYMFLAAVCIVYAAVILVIEHLWRTKPRRHA